MEALSNAIYKNFIKDDRWRYITSGLGVTLKVTFFAVLIGILLLVNPVYFTAGIVIAAGILLILGGPDERLALLQGLARRGGV